MLLRRISIHLLALFLTLLCKGLYYDGYMNIISSGEFLLLLYSLFFPFFAIYFLPITAYEVSNQLQPIKNSTLIIYIFLILLTTFLVYKDFNHLFQFGILFVEDSVVQFGAFSYSLSMAFIGLSISNLILKNKR